MTKWAETWEIEIVEGNSIIEDLNDIEKFLLKRVMESCKYNQVKGAEAWGVSRGTFRKLLKKHFDNKYFKTLSSKEDDSAVWGSCV